MATMRKVFMFFFWEEIEHGGITMIFRKLVIKFLRWNTRRNRLTCNFALPSKMLPSMLIMPLCLLSVSYSGMAFSDISPQQHSTPVPQSNLLLASKSTELGISNKIPKVKDLDQAVSLYALGLKYLHGKGVIKNNLKALRLFKKSAKQGYPRADYQLGIMYRDGVGAGRDRQAAIKWFRLAAAWGELDAKKALEELINGKSSKNGVIDGASNNKLQKTATVSTTPQQIYLRAMIALSGFGNGGKINFKNAFALLNKSARLNHKESQYELGLLYKNGKGTSKNLVKAKKWLNLSISNGYTKARVALRELVVLEEKYSSYKTKSGYYNFSADSTYISAAKKGDPGAQFKLGLMYIEGDLIERNPSKGIAWLRRAADHKYLDAQVKLGDLLYKGVQLDRDYAESAKWYQKAADQGHAGAQYILANMYKKGLGIARDRRKADKWYREAARLGHIQARDKISQL